MMLFEVSFSELSGAGAFSACLLLALLFVLSLYAVDPGLSRSHPKTVRRRLLAIAVVCLLSPLYLWAWSDERGANGRPVYQVLGIKCEGILPAIVIPLLLVLVLYTGPVVQSWLAGEQVFDHITTERTDINIRNYVFAPVSEEVVFRGCMIPLLLPHLGEMRTVLLAPLFFGVAHLHHVVEWLRTGKGHLATVLVTLTVQVGYTSIFGMFSAYLFIRTGHLLSPIMSHTLCNAFGLPDFGGITGNPRPIGVALAYVSGLFAFLFLLFGSPLMEPELYTLCVPYVCTVVIVTTAIFAVFVFYCILRQKK